MSWYKVAMTVDEVAGGKGIWLQEQFENLFMRALAPVDAAMCGAMDVMSNDYIFSPGAVRISHLLMQAAGGVPCEAPKLSEVAFLVTNRGAEGIPFAPE